MGLIVFTYLTLITKKKFGLKPCADEHGKTMTLKVFEISRGPAKGLWARGELQDI